MAVRVILPTFGKSRKTTKSDPSTGDQLGNENFSLNLFQQSSLPFRADRWVNDGSNKEPLISNH